jgi:nicotinate-nucleotide--dimethylbenzimidazole phosphoribosyltransferase
MTAPWWNTPTQPLNHTAHADALARQQVLTKPAGALGLLETVAVTLAGMQGQVCPQLKQPFISIFAADHGIAQSGVSAFPPEVTVQMVANFAQGGAAICVLSRQIGAIFEVVDVGVAAETHTLTGVIQAKTAHGTANFLNQPAMTATQFDAALAAGQAAIARAVAGGADAFIGGEMGIGNTASASALACVWLGCSAIDMTGAGTGLDAAGVTRKAHLVQQALDHHAVSAADPIHVMMTFAGFEIIALVGAYIAAAQAGLPVIVDGFISSVAALSAVQLQPHVRDWMLFGHVSAEQAHHKILTAMQATPLLQLHMRLGEGSGAATAWPLLQSACALHAQMATFAEAAVSGQSEPTR